MIYNIIGPPGSGKTTYIRTRFGFCPPMKTIDEAVFNEFLEKKVFEHTGMNSRINHYLAESGEKIVTIWFHTTIPVCLYRIIRDFFRGRASIVQTGNRLVILCYYRKNAGDIFLAGHRRQNELIVIRTRSPVTGFILSRIGKIFSVNRLRK